MPIKNSQILVNFPMPKSSISLGVTIKPQVKSVVTGFFTLKILLHKYTRLIFRDSTFQDPKINISVLRVISVVLRNIRNVSLHWLLTLKYLYNLIWLQRWLKYTFSQAKLQFYFLSTLWKKFKNIDILKLNLEKHVLLQINYVCNLIGSSIS